MRRVVALSLISLLGLSSSVVAQPVAGQAAPWDQPVGETVADRPSNVYRFEKHRLDSADGKRHYRIEIAIPRNSPPVAGFPVLYMLDGNAAMATLTEDDLARMAQNQAAVIVAIGYDIAVRNDVVSRAYDYTPPLGASQSTRIVDERGRATGGAEVFFELIQQRIRPLIRERAPVDPARAVLWGHSYGGLFALHVLFTHPDAFAAYVAGDPSMWWGKGALLQEGRRFDMARAAGKRVAVLLGTKPRPPRAAPPGAKATAEAIAERSDPRPRMAFDALMARLDKSDINVTYETFPQYGHGEMIRVSLARALEIVSPP